MFKTVYLKSNQDTGRPYYGLSLSKSGINTTIKSSKLKGQTFEVRSRARRDDEGNLLLDPEVIKEQSEYNYHYALLPIEHEGVAIESLVDMGFPKVASLDVMTGELRFDKVS